MILRSQLTLLLLSSKTASFFLATYWPRKMVRRTIFHHVVSRVVTRSDLMDRLAREAGPLRLG